MRPRLLLPLLLASLIAGCHEPTPVLQVVPRIPDDATLFADLDALTLRLEQAGVTQMLARFPGDTTALELPTVPFGDAYSYVLEGWMGETLVARGRTCTVDVDSAAAVTPTSLYFSRLAVFFDTGDTVTPFVAPLLLARGNDALALGGGAIDRYDGATGAFTPHSALSPACPARGARLAPLRNGDALLVGGWRADGAPALVACAYRRALDSVVELRTSSSLLRLDLDGHSLTPLGDGKVLLVGNRLVDGTFVKDAAAAWLYDDTEGTWSQIASIGTARADHAAVATSSTDAGEIAMIVGGRASDGTVLDTIEVYNPVRGQFTEYPAHLVTPRAQPTATYVPGQEEVVVAGGLDSAGSALDTIEVIVPYEVVAPEEPMSPAGTPSEQTGREGHTATRLANGLVLVTGGRDAAGDAISSALLFDPVALKFADGGALRHARAEHAALTLCDGTVLVVGGADATGAVLTAEVYNPAD
jgi:large repetitive protein